MAKRLPSSITDIATDMALALTLLTVCLLYTGAFLIGWSLATRDRLGTRHLMRPRRSFTDPLTRRFQHWCDRRKMDALRQRQWSRMWLLISANNLVAVALVGRTLYGITLVPAVYFTYRQGLSQGAFFAQPSLRPRGTFMGLAVLEFGAYLLATALGVNLVVGPAIGGTYTDAVRSIVLLYPVVAGAVLLSAWLEVRWVRSRIPVDLELPADLNLEEMRAKALEMMKKSQSLGA